MRKIELAAVLIVFVVSLFVPPLTAHAEELMGNRGGCWQRVSYPAKVVSMGDGAVTVEVKMLNNKQFTISTSLKWKLKLAVKFGGCVALDENGKKIIVEPFTLAK